jgi:hypothetical protein
MPAGRSTTTLGERLRGERRRLFVGRTREVELFRAALDQPEPPFSVLYVHGPGGIGKASLLDVFAASAEECGVRLVRVDGRELEPPGPVPS